jgi:hypothetical protein
MVIEKMSEGNKSKSGHHHYHISNLTSPFLGAYQGFLAFFWLWPFFRPFFPLLWELLGLQKMSAFLWPFQGFRGFGLFAFSEASHF